MDGTQDPQPQQWTQPQAGCPHPETMKHEHPQGDPKLLVPSDSDQVTVVTPVRAALPPRLQQGPQADTQGPLEPSQAQQRVEVASQDMVVADSELGGWRTATDAAPDSPMSTGSASPISRWGNDVWFGVGENNTSYAYTDFSFYGGNPIGSYASLNLGGGEDGVVMEATPSPTLDSGVWRVFDEHRDMF